MLLILLVWKNDVSCIQQVINALSRHCNHTFISGEHRVKEMYLTDIHS